MAVAPVRRLTLSCPPRLFGALDLAIVLALAINLLISGAPQ
jgi:hypothetical protein